MGLVESTRVDFCCFFNDTATTEIYTLSLHDALPILLSRSVHLYTPCGLPRTRCLNAEPGPRLRATYAPRAETYAQTHLLRCRDRKSTRLNSSHANISYAVFCLQQKVTPLGPGAPGIP